MKYNSRNKAVLILADGTQFFGKSTGIDGTSFGEICYNTGMTGYQEIFTDPSYYGQLMVTTNAHIGNYGVLNYDAQSKGVKISGLICKNFSYVQTRPGAAGDLFSYFKDQKIVAISDVDTRALVSYIRDNGAMNAVLTTNIGKIDKIQNELKEFPSMDGLELASKVSTKKTYFLGNPKSKYKVAVLDLGVKQNILNHLINRDVYLKVFPYNSNFETLSSWKPDGYFISNGPGDPKPLFSAQKLAKKIIDKNLPLFGICLGHQIIAIANKIPTYKMFNGHRGINHPVINHETGKGEITSQNHGFAIEKKAAESNKDIIITHTHLNDRTVAGIRIKSKKCFSVQYHPEAAPGPNDSNYLFDEFINLLKN
ncbi:MAG: carbamoyl phosphate synthase small subunit [Flavobacteriaceae bacterium]|nr:carbamoyl phosphate synthase small subunit [Flavobacteriaceae bacterium]|tara:strand:+ start:7327 stop:8427 length:1101 start_codon:yes stop_codon:yes gene_type:complete